MTIAADSLIATNKFHKKLGKLIEPLEPYFGIKQFCYYRLFSDGTASYINTDPGLIEHFAYNGLYSSDPHQVDPGNMGFGFITWSLCDDYKNVVDMMERDFDVAHGVSYLLKGKDSYEALAFSAPEFSAKTQRRMQNDSKYLLKFIEYLKIAAAPIFKQATEEYRINLAAIKENYYTQQGIIPNIADDKEDLVNLLVRIGLVDPAVANVRLSAQERKCVLLIIQGKSVKQVAKELNLSPRTVEGYLTNVRQKLGIYFTRDLFELKDSLLELGMLD